MSQIWCIFLGVFYRKFAIFQKLFGIFLICLKCQEVFFSNKEVFFQIKCWKYLHGQKVAHKKLTGVWKCILFTKRHRKAHAHKHIDRQTSIWLVIFLHNFSKIDSCHLKFHKLFFFKFWISTFFIQFQRPSVTSGPPCIIMHFMSNTIYAQTYR